MHQANTFHTKTHGAPGGFAETPFYGRPPLSLQA